MTGECRAWIKEVGRGPKGARDLPEPEAAALYGAMLDGEIGELELGALLMAYRLKGESVGELCGFVRATQARTAVIARAPAAFARAYRPIVFASYNGARKQPNLLPLLAMLLARHGVPVLIHGVLSDERRVATASILAALGVAPCSDLSEVTDRFAAGLPAFVPIEVLSPKLARLLATRERLGVRSSAHTVVKLINPLPANALRFVAVTHPDYLERARETLIALGADALLMRGTEGEPFAGPRRLPQIEHITAGASRVAIESQSFDVVESAPDAMTSQVTAAWTLDVLRGLAPVPASISLQLACCNDTAQQPAPAANRHTQHV